VILDFRVFSQEAEKFIKTKAEPFFTVHITADTDNTLWDMEREMHTPTHLCENSLHRGDWL